MKISTRGRYALRIMADIAERSGGDYIPLKDIVERQGLSLKYAESIMIDLSKSSLVDAAHGKGGGYRLVRRPEEYPIGEILRVTEGSLDPVSCVGGTFCPRSSDCRTAGLWKELGDLINDFLDKKTLADIALTKAALNFDI